MQRRKHAQQSNKIQNVGMYVDAPAKQARQATSYLFLDPCCLDKVLSQIVSFIFWRGKVNKRPSPDLAGVSTGLK
jgi:hypothetical protein